jgi:hypothetical protein
MDLFHCTHNSIVAGARQSARAPRAAHAATALSEPTASTVRSRTLNTLSFSNSEVAAANAARSATVTGDSGAPATVHVERLLRSDSAIGWLDTMGLP